MATKKITIERFSITSTKPFAEVFAIPGVVGQVFAYRIGPAYATLTTIAPF